MNDTLVQWDQGTTDGRDHHRQALLPIGSSDAALAPIMSTARNCSPWSVLTRSTKLMPLALPGPSNTLVFLMQTHLQTNSKMILKEEGLLLRTADLIGQLGEPNYMKKSNAANDANVGSAFIADFVRTEAVHFNWRHDFKCELDENAAGSLQTQIQFGSEEIRLAHLALLFPRIGIVGCAQQFVSCDRPQQELIDGRRPFGHRH